MFDLIKKILGIKLGGNSNINPMPIKSFLGLNDTPNSYTLQGGKLVKVKVDASGLEFGDAPATDFLNADSMPVAVGGYPIGTSFPASQSMQDMWNNLLYPYTAPLISLSALSPAEGIREFGNPVLNVVLSAVTTKRSDAITRVKFKRNGSDINTVASPNPNGGTETYTETTDVETTTYFSAEVYDDTTAVQSNNRYYSFVYPYLYGAGSSGKLFANMYADLTHSISAYGNKTISFSPSSQVIYFGYPASYPDLTSILDPNGFEIIGDFTKRTGNVVGLDGSSQSYKIYEFNNLTTQTNFAITFKY